MNNVFIVQRGDASKCAFQNMLHHGLRDMFLSKLQEAGLQIIKYEDPSFRDSVNETAYEGTAADEIVDLQTCAPVLRSLFQNELMRALAGD